MYSQKTIINSTLFKFQQRSGVTYRSRDTSKRWKIRKKCAFFYIQIHMVFLTEIKNRILSIFLLVVRFDIVSVTAEPKNFSQWICSKFFVLQYEHDYFWLLKVEIKILTTCTSFDQSHDSRSVKRDLNCWKKSKFQRTIVSPWFGRNLDGLGLNGQKWRFEIKWPLVVDF